MTVRFNLLCAGALLASASLACNLPFLREAAPNFASSETPPAEEAGMSDANQVEGTVPAGTQEQDHLPSSASPSPSSPSDAGTEPLGEATGAGAATTPTATPSTVGQTTAPSATPKPSSTPKPTAEPSDTPQPTGVPSATLTVTPSSTPLPTAAPSDTPKLSPPAAPEKLRIAERVCNEEEYTLLLEWSDVAENEEGFRVYRDDKPIASLKANIEGFTYKSPDTRPHTFAVEAFNQAGVSKRISVPDKEGCQF